MGATPFLLGRGTLAALVAVAVLVPPARAETGPSLIWAKQFGTSGEDECYDLAPDAMGNVYLVGRTEGNLAGPMVGALDGFVMKYGADGNRIWGTQGITSDWKRATLDHQGRLIVGGPGLFLGKYDPLGNVLWSQRFDFIYCHGVGADRSGSIFVGGTYDGNTFGPWAGSWDSFVFKCNSDGNLLWGRQFGTSDLDFLSQLAVDALGNAYVTGVTNGSLFGTSSGMGDVYLCKYDGNGSLAWGTQFGSPVTTWFSSLAVDSGGSAYVAWISTTSEGPYTYGDLLVRKYDPNGSLVWGKQVPGTFEVGTDIAVDGSGVYVVRVGRLLKFNLDGNLAWSEPIPSFAEPLVALGESTIWISGYTGYQESVFGPNAGEQDIVLMAFTPEPCTLSLLVLGGVAILRRRR
jgi:hypothetical protein